MASHSDATVSVFHSILFEQLSTCMSHCASWKVCDFVSLHSSNLMDEEDRVIKVPLLITVSSRPRYTPASFLSTEQRPYSSVKF